MAQNSYLGRCLWELLVRSVSVLVCALACFLIAAEHPEEMLIVISRYFTQTACTNYSISFNYNNVLLTASIFSDLALWVSTLCVYPYGLLQLFFFINKGMYTNEKKLLNKIIQIFLLTHVIFILSYFFVILPFILGNMNEISEEFDFQFIFINLDIDLMEYIHLIKTLFVLHYLVFYAIPAILYISYLAAKISTLNIIATGLCFNIFGAVLIIKTKQYQLLESALDLCLNYFLIHLLVSYSVQTLSNRLN